VKNDYNLVTVSIWIYFINSCDGKAEFSASCHMIIQKSFRIHSNMMIFCSRNISF